MAPIVKTTDQSVVPLLKLAIIISVGFVFLVVISAVWSMPLHNFQLWRLERHFEAVAPLHHPPESVLVEKKKYLGGPAEHGSLVCDFYAGEVRSAPLSKEKIRAAYGGEKSLTVLFFDEEPWTMESPLGDWWGEWYQDTYSATIPDTLYLVFTAQTGYPFLGDMRCDD